MRISLSMTSVLSLLFSGFIGFVGLTGTAHNTYGAEADPVGTFRAAQERLVSSLRQSQLLPREIITDLSRVEIRGSREFQKNTGSTRWSAFADPKNGVVYLNLEQKNQSESNTLVLHELLSAAGWNDTNYERSILIDQLSEDFDRPFLSPEIRKLYLAQVRSMKKFGPNRYFINDGKIIDNLNSRLGIGDGGAVIIGGGGDLKSAEIKSQLLKKFNEQLAQNPSYRLKNLRPVLLGAKIESIPAQSYGRKIRVKAKYDAKVKDHQSLFLVPKDVSIQQGVRDAWTFFIFFSGFNRTLLTNSKNPNQAIDLFIPRDIEEKNNFLDLRSDRRKFFP